MDTIPGRKQALPAQASLLTRSALCGDEERRASRALAGHHLRALTSGRSLSSLPHVLKEPALEVVVRKPQASWIESRNSSQQ